MTEFLRPPETFALTEYEKGTDLWHKLKAYLEDANERDRRKNDDLSLGIEDTRNLRAMINARKSLLSLDH